MQSHKSKIIFLIAGIIFLCLEIFKQIYLFFFVWEGRYDVWYFPFQLCSMPIYLCFILGLIKSNPSMAKISAGVETFLMDFGILGGVLALIVREGFTFSEHPLLTAHGFVWHILMIALGIYIAVEKSGESKPQDDKGKRHNIFTAKEFLAGAIVYLVCAGIAFIINILLHRFGDCDMFYISPYHISAQPVFSSIDQAVGRPIGIIIYILTTILGAGIIHLAISKIREVL